MSVVTADRRRRDRGSVMMLMPAGIVIMLLLGAIAVDSAIGFLAQRQALNIADDAANDAAGAAVRLSSLREDGATVLDPERARSVAARSVHSATSGGADVQLESVEILDDDSVAVTVSIEVDRLFGRAFGAGDDLITVTATAEGRQGP